MTPAEQIADLKARSNPLRNVNITQGSNGYIVQGNTRFVDKESGAVNLEDNQTAVATEASVAGNLATVFLANGTFLPA